MYTNSLLLEQRVHNIKLRHRSTMHSSHNVAHQALTAGQTLIGCRCMWSNQTE
jgi:hypothetical protein